jgi:hypothetical protein
VSKILINNESVGQITAASLKIDSERLSQTFEFDESGEYKDIVWRDDLKLRLSKPEDQDSVIELD